MPDDDEVGQCRDQLAHSPPGHPDRLSRLISLGMALFDRYSEDGRPEDLRESIAVTGAAADLAGPGHPARGMCLTVLGHALRTSQRITGDADELERAIEALAEAGAALPERHEGRVLVQDDLAMLYSARFRATDDPADLDRAIEAMTVAVRLAGPGDLDRPAYASNLGLWLTSRFTRFARPEDARQAVHWLEWALAELPGGDPDRVEHLVKLGDALYARAEADGAVADLDRAIAVAHQALDAMPPGDDRRAETLSALDLAHLARYELAGEPADVDEAIRWANAAVRAATDVHDQVMYRSNLANRLMDRFGRAGGIEDLENAVRTLAEAVTTVPDGHPDKPGVLSNYGAALVGRHRFTGDPADLEEAIGSYRRAVAEVQLPDVGRSMYLSNLGNALAGLFEQTGDEAALDQAIGAHDDALGLLPPGHANGRRCLGNLADALLKRHQLTGGSADLDRAIAAGEEAVRRTAPDQASIVIGQTTLTTVLQVRFERDGDPADLDRAIDAARAALAAAPPGHLARATCLHNLARAHDLRYVATRDPADRARAAELETEAMTDTVAPFPVRMEAARQNGRRAAQDGDWPAAADSYALLVGLLPMVTLRRTPRSSQEQLFSDWPGVPSAAAAFALMAGRPEEAIRVLDQGRGVLWAQSLDRHDDLSLLEQRAPELARQVHHLRAQLDATSPGGSRRRLSLAREWETLLARINAEPGLGEAWRPPSITRLRQAAAGGPVIVVNVSAWRCDALILTRGAVVVVPLPRLTQDAVMARTQEYFQALYRAADEPGGTEEQVLTAVLEWLWDSVAEPVLAELGHTRLPREDERWPQVTWCPTGPLALLPIHAAGYHRPEHAADGRTVLDRVVSSYTTTLRAAARRPEKVPAGNGRLLFVGMPATPGGPRLRGVAKERDAVTAHLGRDCAVLEGPAATREAVRSALAQHTMAHFSCHGRQDLDRPTTGGLILHDGTLSVADLTRASPRGEFAFLSACETALGSISVVDEVVTLAAALQYAGWRHVIATLWMVSDSIAAEVTRLVYARIAGQGRLHPEAAATALHNAVRTLRDRRRATGRHHPSQWVPFIHVGSTGP